MLPYRTIPSNEEPTKELLINERGGDYLSEAKSVYRQIVIPMAMPLLVGPGVIANVILYASEAESKLGDGMGIEMILMTILVSFLVFLILAAGQWLQRLLGDIGLSITQRVMGLFVAAIGVQFMVKGLINIFGFFGLCYAMEGVIKDKTLTQKDIASIFANCFLSRTS